MNIASIAPDETPTRSSGRDTSKYVVAGERVPSVTEVLKLAQLSDIQRIIRVAGLDVVRNAARRGHMVHRGCEAVDHDPSFPVELLPESVRGYVLAYRNFIRETVFEPLFSEEVVVSSAYRFAGTVDRVGYYGGRLYGIDLKTPVALDPAWPIQTAGYGIALDEQLGERTHRACLQLRPNGKWHFHPHTDPQDRHTFLAALHVAHFRLAHGLAALES